MSTDKASHTPGPWFVNWAGSGKDGNVVYDECYVYAPETGVDDVAVAADISDPLTGRPSISNACLIAAAPDMLAALKVLLAAVSVRIDDPRISAFDSARAAIAKAEQP